MLQFRIKNTTLVDYELLFIVYETIYPKNDLDLAIIQRNKQQICVYVFPHNILYY